MALYPAPVFMRCIIVMMLSLLYFCHNSPAEETSATTAIPEFKKQYMQNLKDKITPLVTKYYPGTEVTFDPNASELEIKAKAQTMIYTVHGRSMTGYIEQTHQEEGPKARGFIINIVWRDGLDMDQWAGRGYVREPYWDRYCIITRLEKAKGKTYANLHYGTAPVEKFVDEIKAIFDAQK